MPNGDARAYEIPLARPCPTRGEITGLPCARPDAHDAPGGCWFVSSPGDKSSEPTDHKGHR